MSLALGRVKFNKSEKRHIVWLRFLSVCEFVFTVIVIISLAANILSPSRAKGALGVSAILSYQGRLTDASGNPLGGSGTKYCFRFSIYDATSSGSRIWPASPTGTSTDVVNGVFNIGIGQADDLSTLNFYSTSTVYLNVEVAQEAAGSCSGVSWESLSPRQRIDAVGYARVSRDVYGDLLRTLNASSLVQIGTGAGAASPKYLSLDWKNTSDTIGGACSPSGAVWYNSNISTALVCNLGVIRAFGTTGTTTIAGIKEQSAASAISSGTVSFSANRNLSILQNGQNLEFSGPSLEFGLSNLGNTASESGTVASRLILVGGNNITLSGNVDGQSATVSIVGGAGGGGIASFANSQTTYTSGLVILSEQANITINSSVNAGSQYFRFSAPAGGGGGATLSGNLGNLGPNTQVAQLGQSTLHVWPCPMYQQLSISRANAFVSMSISSSSNSSHGGRISMDFGLYTNNNSTLSLSVSTSTVHSWTNTAAGSTASLSGLRMASIPFAVNLTPGNYWCAFLSRTGTVNANWFTASNMLVTFVNVAFSGNLSAATAASRQLFPGWGMYSAQTDALPNYISFSQLSGTTSANIRQPIINFVNFTT